MNYSVEQLRERHSVRRYKNEPLTGEIKSSLMAEVTMTNTHEAGLNFQLIFDNGDPFRGFSRSYGMFGNVRNYLVCIVDASFANAVERAGFFAEQFVMKAVGLGLGTCFVGGTFSEKDIDIPKHVYETIPFIVTFGYPEEKTQTILSSWAMKMSHRHDLSPRDFFEGSDKEFKKACGKYPFLSGGLEGLACAPSSLNRQTVRVRLDENGNLRIHNIKNYPKNEIDLGIGKFNFASAANAGEWEWGDDSIFLPF